MAAIILRPEPYDPDAIDGDGDGIVQERTPWERPVGTRLLDFSGLEIERGRSLTERPAGIRTVDSSGREVGYTPSYERQGIAGRSSLSRLGYMSLMERGAANVRAIRGPRVVRAPEKLVSDSFDDDVRRGKSIISPVGKQGLNLIKPKQRRYLDRQKKIASSVLEKVDDPQERTLLNNVAFNSTYWATTVADSSGSLTNVLDGIWSGRQESGYSPHQVIDEMYEWGGTSALAVPLMLLKERMNLTRRQVNQVAERMKERFRALKIRSGTMNDDLKKRFGSSMDSVRSAWKTRESAEIRDVEHLADLMEDTVAAGIREPDVPEPDFDDHDDDDGLLAAKAIRYIGGEPTQAAPTILGKDHPELEARLAFIRENPRPDRAKIEKVIFDREVAEETEARNMDPIEADRWVEANYESIEERIADEVDELFWEERDNWNERLKEHIRSVTGRDVEEQWDDEAIEKLLRQATDVSLQARVMSGGTLSVAESAALGITSPESLAGVARIDSLVKPKKMQSAVGRTRLRSLFGKKPGVPQTQEPESPPEVSKEAKEIIADIQQVGKEIRAEAVRRILESDPELLREIAELEETRKMLIEMEPELPSKMTAAFEKLRNFYAVREFEREEAAGLHDGKSEEDKMARRLELLRQWAEMPGWAKRDWIEANRSISDSMEPGAMDELDRLLTIRHNAEVYGQRADALKKEISKVFRSVVAELRPLGGDVKVGKITGDTTQWATTTEAVAQEAQDALDTAVEYFPTDLIEALGGEIEIEVKKRAFWRRSWMQPDGTRAKPTLGFTPKAVNGQHSVSIHELGHGVAAVEPEIEVMERLFLLSRIEEDTEAIDYSYDPAKRELCYADQFFSLYCGKLYGGMTVDAKDSRQGTEIMSMGLQRIFGIDMDIGSGRTPPMVEPLLPDEAYMDFVLGLLVTGGLSRSRAKERLAKMSEEQIYDLVYGSRAAIDAD